MPAEDVNDRDPSLAEGEEHTVDTPDGQNDRDEILRLAHGAEGEEGATPAGDEPDPPATEEAEDDAGEGDIPDPEKPASETDEGQDDGEAEKPDPEPAKSKPVEWSADPHDDPEDLSEDLQKLDPRFTKIKAGIDKLRGKLRDARATAHLGDAFRDIAASGNLNEDDAASWLDLGARLNRGDRAAADRIVSLLKQVSYPFHEVLGQAAPQPQGTPPANTQSDPVESFYTSKLAPLVESGDMGEDAARALAKELAPRQASQPPTPTPPPTPPAPQPSLSQPAPQQPPQQSPLETRELQKIRTMQEQYAAAIPDWDEVSKKVAETIKEEGVYNTMPALSLVPYYTSVVRKVQAQRAEKTSRTQGRVAPASNGRSGKSKQSQSIQDEILALARNM